MAKHTVFTDHIRNYDSGDFPQQVLDKIQSSLVGLLKKRGLWTLGPVVLGYAGEKWTADPLESLTFDCYCHVFLGIHVEESDPDSKPGNNLTNWKKHVQSGAEIEGMVYRSIKNFIHDQQKKSSPSSSAIYTNLSKTFVQLVEDTELHVCEGDPARFSLEWICGTSESSPDQKLSFDELADFLRGSENWHAAMGAIQKISKKARAFLAEGVREMISAGKEPFLTGELKKFADENAFSLVDEVEEQFRGEVSVKDGQISDIFRTCLDSDRYEFKETRVIEFAKLIHEGIDRLERRKSTKQKLHDLLDYLVKSLRETALDEDVKQADITRELNIARSTLNDYMKEIRTIAGSVESNA